MKVLEKIFMIKAYEIFQIAGKKTKVLERTFMINKK